MKSTKRIISLILALVMAFSASVAVFAADVDDSLTVELLEDIAKTEEFKATATSFTYDNITNKFEFDVYANLDDDEFCCDLTKDKGFKVIADNSEIKVVIPRFFCYLSVDTAGLEIAKELTKGTDILDTVFDKFLDDPDLSSFRFTTETVKIDGEEYTLEKFTGKAIAVSGSFYYNEDDELSRIDLTDTLGESISLTLKDVETSFENDVFDVPFYFLNLSLLFKILSMFMSISLV